MGIFGLMSTLFAGCQNAPSDASNPSDSPVPAVAAGSLVSFDFHDDVLGERRADVWIPGGVATGDSLQWVWMHDGQMLYDFTVTWNGQEWMVDETLQSLIDSNRCKPTIIIGLYNSENRHRELCPSKPIEADPALMKELFADGLWSDRYLKFAVEQVIPGVLNSLPYEFEPTGWVAGSSMGGLISAYALCEYPAVFCGAMCLSTHWPGVNPGEYPAIPELFINYFSSHLPTDSGHAIYFDSGDETLDQYYPPHHRAMEAALAQRDSTGSGLRYKFEFFPGANHTEHAWSKRLHIPFEWALSQ